jgi:putative FmdB family regulatory protein
MLNLPTKGSRILPSPFFKTVEARMPQYEFFCNACKKTFSRILTIVRHEKEKIACPHCGGKNVEQRWSAFSAITSKKSA